MTHSDHQPSVQQWTAGKSGIAPTLTDSELARARQGYHAIVQTKSGSVQRGFVSVLQLKGPVTISPASKSSMRNSPSFDAFGL